MKRTPFITFFFVLQVVFVILHLQKQSKIIQLSYTKQKNEHEKETLVKKKQALTHELYTLHDPVSIKQFAQDKLDLKPMSIYQVKRLSNA